MTAFQLSNQLKTLRQDLGATQEEVAIACGVSRQTIIAIEHGNYVPSVMLALRLARFFKVPVESLFSISKSP